MSDDSEPLPSDDPNRDVVGDIRWVWNDWSSVAANMPNSQCTHCGASMHVRAHVGRCPLAGEDPVRPTPVPWRCRHDRTGFCPNCAIIISGV